MTSIDIQSESFHVPGVLEVVKLNVKGYCWMSD